MPLHSLARKQPDRNLEGILAHHALRSFDDARVEIEQNILASAGKSASKPANDDYSFRTKSYSAPTYGSQFVSYAMGNAYHERFVRNDVNDSYNGLSQLSWAIHRAELVISPTLSVGQCEDQSSSARWSGQWELNPRPLAPHASALPLRYGPITDRIIRFFCGRGN